METFTILSTIAVTGVVFLGFHYMGVRYQTVARQALARAAELEQGLQEMGARADSANQAAIMLARTVKREGAFTIAAPVVKSVDKWGVSLDQNDSGSIKVTVNKLGK